jgi:membrane protein implicated in regulation of membrane protease activity
MQVKVAFSDQSIDEVQRVHFAWLMTTYEIVAEILPVGIVFAFPIAAVVNMVQQTASPAPEWSSAVGLLIVSLIPVGLVLWRFRRRQQRRRKKVAAAYPQTLIFNSEGIETYERGGRILFAPWRYYSGFKEGEFVFLLRLTRGFTYRAIPIDLLSLEARGQLRAVLLNYLREL